MLTSMYTNKYWEGNSQSYPSVNAVLHLEMRGMDAGLCSVLVRLEGCCSLLWSLNHKGNLEDKLNEKHSEPVSEGSLQGERAS